MFDAVRSSDRLSDPAEEPGLRRVEAAGEAMLACSRVGLRTGKYDAQRTRLHDSSVVSAEVGRRKYQGR